MTVGEFIKKLAKEQGSSAAQIERELGYSNGYIGKTRDRAFPSDRLSEIADYLGVSPEYLSSCGHNGSGRAGDSPLNHQERRLLHIFRSVSADGQAMILEQAEILLASGRYIKTGAQAGVEAV